MYKTTTWAQILKDTNLGSYHHEEHHHPLCHFPFKNEKQDYARLDKLWQNKHGH
jgi:hypothetical protein